jgi:HPt (histidine-containing phosphotransfer) domain-containing protein
MTYLNRQVLDDLVEILGQEDIRMIVAAFVDQLDVQLGELDRHSTPSELSRCAQVAHTLKGGAGNLGAQALSAAAADLECHARNGDVEQVSRLVLAIREIASSTVAELRERGHIES